MKKQLFIHIGIGKTGTTSLQGFAYYNRKKLAKLGLLYPKNGLSHWGHHALAVNNTDIIAGNILHDYELVRKEIDGFKGGKILISSENFCYSTSGYVEEMHKYFKDYDVKIIFFVREQRQLAESTYKTWLRLDYKFSQSFEEFVRSSSTMFNYMLRISPWIEQFGQENIIVRVYRGGRNRNDTLTEVLNILDLSDKIEIPVLDYNSSLLPELVNISTLINKVNIDELEKKNLQEALLISSDRLRDSSNSQLITDELSEFLREAYLETNKKFSELFLGDDDVLIF